MYLMKFEDIMLSELRQSQKDTCLKYLWLFLYKVPKLVLFYSNKIK